MKEEVVITYEGVFFNDNTQGTDRDPSAQF